MISISGFVQSLVPRGAFILALLCGARRRDVLTACPLIRTLRGVLELEWPARLRWPGRPDQGFNRFSSMGQKLERIDPDSPDHQHGPDSRAQIF